MILKEELANILCNKRKHKMYFFRKQNKNRKKRRKIYLEKNVENNLNDFYELFRDWAQSQNNMFIYVKYIIS